MKVRPMKKIVLFPVMSYKILGSVGRQTFFFFFFLYRKCIKIFKNNLKIVLNIPEGQKKVWMGPKKLGSVG